MNDPRILISGDYWNQEFQSIVANFPVPVTLAPVDRLESFLDQPLDLIVLAQARPDQIPGELITQLQQRQPTTPIVALLGSWCEGGMRSDVPWPGVRRLYWHQWNGRFEEFAQQLEEGGVSIWNAPPTATQTDDVLSAASGGAADLPNVPRRIGVSANDQAQYEALSDTIESFGWQACWLERTTLDQEATQAIDAICMDGNSASENLLQRIKWLQTKLPSQPIALILNFPRSQDLAVVQELGVVDVVSKPFQPQDVQYALQQGIGRAAGLTVAGSPTRAPHAWQSRKSVTDNS